MLARVYVTLKPGVLDPAGKAVEGSLHALGFGQVSGVRLGKYIELQLECSQADAEKRLLAMCETLLANPVIEDFRYEIG